MSSFLGTATFHCFLFLYVAAMKFSNSEFEFGHTWLRPKKNKNVMIQMQCNLPESCNEDQNIILFENCVEHILLA